MIDYVALEEMKSRLGVFSEDIDEHLQTTISAASRDIDMRCNRYFGQDEESSPRQFLATGDGLLWVDDCTDIEDTDVPGDYQEHPLNGVVSGQSGWPVTHLRHPAIQDGQIYSVTARWGWPAVPDPIREMCGQIVAHWYKRKDAPVGIMNMDDHGTIRVYEPTHVRKALRLYTKHRIGVL